MIKYHYCLLLICSIGMAKAQTAEERLHKDWAYLKRYESLNNGITAPVRGEVRIIYIGDSITELWFINDSLFFTKNKYINRGISGQTTGQMLVRFREDVINAKPSVVLILAGINDIAENNGPSRLKDVMGNIISMAEIAAANHIEAVLCSLLPADHFFWRPSINPVPKVQELNAMIKDYAGKHHLVYLDYFTTLANSRSALPDSLARDGVHPTLAGFKLMEPLAQAAIESALKQKQMSNNNHH